MSARRRGFPGATWGLTWGLAVLLAGCVAPDGEGPGSDDSGGGVPTGEFQEKGAAIGLCSNSATGAPVLKRLTAREFTASLRDVFPAVADAWEPSFSADPVSHYGFENNAELLQVTKQTAREIDQTATAVGRAVKDDLEAMLPCSAAAADRACAGEFLASYGKRLFRRPLSDPETEKFLAFFDEALAKTDFPTAISWLTRALIHSPEMVYRHEIGTLADGARELTQYEIAAALAYTYTGTTPTDALLDKADQGELDSPEALVATARDLIATSAGREHLHRFFEAWLEYSRVTTVTKANVEDFESLRTQMREETRRYLETVVLDGGGSLQDLLTASTTNPSAELAAFYGLAAPANDYASVARNDGGGIGVLAQGSVLSTEANANASSPTQRGLLVLEKLLCRELPVVPPDVPTIVEPAVGETTTRQRYEEQHASGGACENCHKNFDPMGFGFEHFDEAGRFRQDEGGLAIDASGYVPGDSGPVFSFENQEELAEGLASEAEVQACVSGQFKTYAFGSEEACLAEGQRAAFMAGDVGFLEYMISFAGEPHFTQRLPQ